MNKFLEVALDAINDRIEKVLHKAFVAGQEYGEERGPDFDTWLADEKRKAKGE